MSRNKFVGPLKNIKRANLSKSQRPPHRPYKQHGEKYHDGHLIDEMIKIIQRNLSTAKDEAKKIEKDITKRLEKEKDKLELEIDLAKARKTKRAINYRLEGQYESKKPKIDKSKTLEPYSSVPASTIKKVDNAIKKELKDMGIQTRFPTPSAPPLSPRRPTPSAPSLRDLLPSAPEALNLLSNLVAPSAPSLDDLISAPENETASQQQRRIKFIQDLIRGRRAQAPSAPSQNGAPPARQPRSVRVAPRQNGAPSASQAMNIDTWRAPRAPKLTPLQERQIIGTLQQVMKMKKKREKNKVDNKKT